MAQATNLGEIPQERVSLRFTLLYAFAFVGFWMALLIPPIMTLAMRVAQLAPENKEHVLSLLMGVGAVIAMLANPIAGQLSDRTASHFGMRKPWIIGGMLVGVLGQFMMASSMSVLFLSLGWWVVQLGFNAAFAALSAVLPDQVPENQRGFVSGFAGMSLQVGVLIGIFGIEHLKLDTFWIFFLPTLVFVGTTLLFLPSFKDKQLAFSPPPFAFGYFFKNFWIDPRKAPDFSWAFLSRFFMWIGLATLLTYQVFFLMSVLKVVPADIPSVMFRATLFTTASTVVGSFLCGWLSDVFNRRKCFVCLSALIYAVGLYMIATANGLEAFYRACAVTGLGQGIYVAVDMALVSQVLPNPKEASKDLGIFNLASALPQSIAPAIAPFFLAIGGLTGEGNYTALFTAAAIWALLGALTILFVRKVK